MFEKIEYTVKRIDGDYHKSAEVYARSIGNIGHG